TSHSYTMPSSTSSFNPTPTSGIYPLSLHDALPIFHAGHRRSRDRGRPAAGVRLADVGFRRADGQFRRHRAAAAAIPAERARGNRSEEHTSELQSLTNLVCRLLLAKKKTQDYIHAPH